MKDTETKILQLKNDNISGAFTLSRRTAEILMDFVKDYDGSKDASAFYEDISRLGRKLVLAQPSMAPVFNCVNSLLLAIEMEIEREGGKDIDSLKELSVNNLDSFVSNEREETEKVSDIGSGLIRNDSVVMVHSYSSLVLETLKKAKKRGKDFEVIATESRPMFEGRLFFEQLEKKDIPATLIVDSAFGSFIENTDLLLFGSDCICYEGIVNKIGTKAMSVAAKEYGKPVYVLSSESKFLPKGYRSSPGIEENDPQEVWERKSIRKSSKISNPYFDITSFGYVTEIITAHTSYGAGAAKEKVSKTKVSKRLS